jgi:hypothetical protein
LGGDYVEQTLVWERYPEALGQRYMIAISREQKGLVIPALKAVREKRSASGTLS